MRPRRRCPGSPASGTARSSTRGRGRRAPCARSARTRGGAPRARPRRRTGRRGRPWASRRRACPCAHSRSTAGSTSAILVRRVEVAQVVPTRARPLRHRVGLAEVRAATAAVTRPRRTREIELDLHPVGGARQRRLGQRVGIVRGGGFEVDHLGQLDRQHRLRQRDRTDIVVDDRERLAPVALPAEQPVAQLVRDGRLAVPVLLEPRDDLALGVGDGEPVEEVAVDRGAVAEVRVAVEVRRAAARCG